MIVHTFTCDKCKTVFTEDDIIQWQERHSYSGNGGYGSHFGDGTYWRVDFCDKCLYDLFSPYLSVVENRYEF
jgi:nitric oxide reductase large subunit